MKTINELIKSYLENEDKAVFGEILDVIRTGDSLFAVAARVTNNFFMGAENAKPAAYIFYSKAVADEFVKELKWEGYEVKSLEIRAAQRIGFFNDLYRSGFEAIVVDKGQESLTMSLFSIVEKPEDNSDIIVNPSLMRAAAQFYQELSRKRAVKPMQDMMCSEIYHAKFLLPSESRNERAYPIITDNKGMKFYPVFTDHIEFGKFDKKQKYQTELVKFRDLKKLVRKVDGIVVNPFGFGLRLDREKIDNIEKECSTLKVVK